jgi:hypothetical protein
MNDLKEAITSFLIKVNDMKDRISKYTNKNYILFKISREMDLFMDIIKIKTIKAQMENGSVSNDRDKIENLCEIVIKINTKMDVKDVIEEINTYIDKIEISENIRNMLIELFNTHIIKIKAYL